MLQFGHSLTAVENREARGTWRGPGLASIWPQPHSRGERPNLEHSPGAERLQFGHSLTAVENQTGAALSRVMSSRASIWPQPHSRGEPGPRRPPKDSRSPRASIWPQPYSRGELSTWRAAPSGGPDQGASIWPQPYSRGELESRANHYRRPRPGFNLATASQPWRTSVLHKIRSVLCPASIWPQPYSRGEPPDWQSCGFGLSRFNLATALQPWRTGQRRREDPAVRAASIWPQPYSRGEPKSMLRSTRMEMLQFGHSLTAVENQAFLGRSRRPRVASIWPQPYSRGELVILRVIPVMVNSASIWPQPYSRGERERLGRHRVPPMLQFGHSLTAVENCLQSCAEWTAPKSFNLATALQPWRTSNTPPGRAARPLSFNLATALQPWRTLHQPVLTQIIADTLQFGHSLTAVENNSGGSLPARPRGERFNLATALQPWRTSEVVSLRMQHGCFNLATALQPWRTRGRGIGLAPDARLQFGHSLTAVENGANPATLISEGRWLQFGHSLTAVENPKPTWSVIPIPTE